ncbi:hypothetical protein HSTV1_28 [Haloarcula sinaiiensis tailed virus 1]|uniref:Uncharacterized protein n=1 Tax=Haloarcula sinaiiensis tailed virus 1 TaxID=1262530 RepID=R9QT39_9CAUD|nr:hypothetical protein HSTV1_28 [Haloarcula sinaiiensis tailed virus 1]AGC34573.1 hypothetical protein HSTV1_28 [Haloarcula sinaiiensis tailed virus 1]
MHELTHYSFTLPDVDEWLSGDSRELAFRVVGADGNGVDITNATVSWSLFDREYMDDPADAVLTGDDSSVEIVTDNRVDSEAGEFEVRLDPAATEDLWGTYWHRPEVKQSDETTASWRGEVVVTA